MDALEDAPKKGKKGKKEAKKKAVVAIAAEEVVDETTAWKGKPSSFFVMPQGTGTPEGNNPNNFEMNDEQWNFIFKYYPEYGSGPYDLMVWIHQQV